MGGGVVVVGPWARPSPGLQTEQGTLKYEELAVRGWEAAGDTRSCLCITVPGTGWGLPRGRSLAQRTVKAQNAGVYTEGIFLDRGA